MPKAGKFPASAYKYLLSLSTAVVGGAGSCAICIAASVFVIIFANIAAFFITYPFFAWFAILFVIVFWYLAAKSFTIVLWDVFATLYFIVLRYIAAATLLASLLLFNASPIIIIARLIMAH